MPEQIYLTVPVLSKERNGNGAGTGMGSDGSAYRADGKAFRVLRPQFFTVFYVLFEKAVI